MYGTYEAFRYKVPGLYKVRYIGQVSEQQGGLHLGRRAVVLIACWRAVPACTMCSALGW